MMSSPPCPADAAAIDVASSYLRGGATPAAPVADNRLTLGAGQPGGKPVRCAAAALVVNDAAVAAVIFLRADAGGDERAANDRHQRVGHRPR